MEELWRRLTQSGFTVRRRSRWSAVRQDGQPLCEVDRQGTVRYLPADIDRSEKSAALEQVMNIAAETAEYMKLMEQAPALKAGGLSGDYRILADFNGAVLAGHPREDGQGVQLATWDWDYDRTGVSHGHYYEAESYAQAKRDFAVRAGLVSKHSLFTEEQLTEVYRCIHETLEGDYPITDARRTLLEEAAEQIERGIPDLEARVGRSSQEELELNDSFQASEEAPNLEDTPGMTLGGFQM